jgi:hypothetical protein
MDDRITLRDGRLVDAEVAPGTKERVGA